MNISNHKSKKLIGFDLDKTLARSKEAITPEMANALLNLMQKYLVVIISGGDFPQFEKQVIEQFPKTQGIASTLKNLHLLPTSGTKYYNFKDGKVTEQYAENFKEEEKLKILDALEKMRIDKELHKLQTWGPQIEDRGTQYTISVLGQQAPVEEKEKWDPTGIKKMELKNFLDELIGEFQVNTGGSTSIDITYKGRDKGYGMNKLLKILNLKNEDAFFIADALHEGGNDYSVRALGIDSFQTSGPDETLEIIQGLVNGVNRL